MWDEAVNDILGKGIVFEFGYPSNEFKRRTPEYVPPEPSPELIDERIKKAEEKRQRKAAKNR